MSLYEKEPLLIEQKVGKNVAAKKDSKKMAEFKESKWRSKAKCQGNLNSQLDGPSLQQQSYLIQERRNTNNQIISQRLVRSNNHIEKLEDKSNQLSEFFTQKRKNNEVNRQSPILTEERGKRVQEILKKVQEKKDKIEKIIRDGLSRYNREVEEIEEQRSLQSDTQTAKFNDISNETIPKNDLEISKVIKQTSHPSLPPTGNQIALHIPNQPLGSQNLHRIRQNLLQRRMQSSNNVQQSSHRQDNLGNPIHSNNFQPVNQLPMNIDKTLVRNAIEATNTFITKDQHQCNIPTQNRPTAMHNIFSCQTHSNDIRHSPSPGGLQSSTRQTMSPRQKSPNPQKHRRPHKCHEHSLNFPLLEIMAGCLSAHWPTTLQQEWRSSIQRSSSCQQYSTGNEMIDENQQNRQAIACATIYRQKLKDDYINLCNGTQESSHSAQSFEHGSGNFNPSCFRQEDRYQQIERQRMEEVSEEVYKEELYRRIMSMDLPIPPLFDNMLPPPPYFNPNYSHGYNPNQQGAPFRPTPYYVPAPYFHPRHASSLFCSNYNRPEKTSTQEVDYYSLRRMNRQPPCPSYRQIKMRRISEYYHQGLANRAKRQQEDEFYRPQHSWNRWQQ